MTNIWLIPASNPLATQNLARSMENEIDIEIQHTLLSVGIHQQYAWGAQRGTNDSNVSIYNSMQPGDICLFYTADQREIDEPVKAYRWAACITEKLDDQTIGDQIWPPERPGESFSLIYFLTTPVKIYIPKEELAVLLTEHGEKYASPPKGFMKLNAENLDVVSQRYGSPEGFLTHVLTHYAQEDPPLEVYPQLAAAAGADNVIATFVNDLLAIKKPKKSGQATVVPQRRSKQSTLIGDKAEKYVLALLKEGLVPGVIARDPRYVGNEKPGWDIQYTNENDDLVKVEVKGSTASKFSSFEVTVNELNCLKEHTILYHFYLVAGCMSQDRKVQIITDMAERLNNSHASASPITYRMELLEP